MRRKILIILTIAAFLLLVIAGHGLVRNLTDAPSRQTRHWQTVYIDNFGNFRIPAEWYVEWQDGVVYITDRPRESQNYTLYLVGSESPPHMLFEGMIQGDFIRGGIFSNSAHWNLFEYDVNGTKEEYHSITFWAWSSGANPDRFELLALDGDVVNQSIVIDIARTFIGN